MKTSGLRKTITLLFFLGVFLITGNNPVIPQELGDVNHDSVRNIVDSLLIARYYVGEEVENFDPDLADTNADGVINIVDSLLVAQLYVGVISILPGEENKTPEPTVDPDYPINWDALQQAFPLKASEEQKLMQNGFVVLDSVKTNTITEAYCNLIDHERVPSFITTDALMHIFHITYAHMLESAEIKYLITKLRTLLGIFNTDVKAEFDDCVSGTLCKEAARQLWIYSAVAHALINGEPEVHGEEISLIELDANDYLIKIYDHTLSSPATGDDYTVYKPRGHYSGDPELEQYFRTMQWLRERKFTFPDGENPLNDEYQFAATAIMGYVIANNAEAYQLWHEIYTFIQKLAISKESITPVMIDQTMNNLFEDEYESEKYTLLNDIDKLTQLKTELDTDNEGVLKYVQFLGEPYYLDNEIMEKTLSPNVVNRYLPGGLDIASVVFNSDAAYELNDEEMNTYSGLRGLIDDLRDQCNSKSDEEWRKTVTDYWLYTLQSLSLPASDYAPAFMKEEAWQREKLNTQLASWAELHSDNVNYEPTPSPTPIPTPTPVPTVSPEPLQLMYRCANTNTSTNQIRFNINIVNSGSLTFDLSDITACYYYTKDGTEEETVSIDYAVIDKYKVSGIFHDGYLEIGFLPEAGTLSPGMETGEIQVRFYKINWNLYDQSNDHSFDSSKTAYTLHRDIPLYHSDGTLLWGDDPFAPTSPPTVGPTAVPTSGPTSPPGITEPTTPVPTTPPSVTSIPTIAPTEAPTPSPTPEPTPIPMHAFVEPYDTFYKRLVVMCDDVIQLLNQAEMTTLIHVSKFNEIGSWAEILSGYVTKLEEGTPLDGEENSFINTWGDKVKTFFNQDTSFVPEQDSKSHVITDIYSFEDQVLHEGIGKLHPVIIIYDDPDQTGGTIAAVGYVLSYYEFIEYNSNRLNDIEWEDKLTTNPPNRPSWTDAFMAY
jgi:hypothetical protein